MEPAGHATTQGKAPGPAGSPSAGPRRFVYAGGDRPLAGYTIKRGIGHGGFGEIYFATSDAGKEVALKLIRRNLDVEVRGTSQCLNLKHPNLLAVYDIRQDRQGDTWVVMEYAAQRSLEEVLAQRPTGLGPEEAMVWFRGIGAAVAYLHDHGIVHRDLKPGNIFRDEGIVKVGDYGLAKFISQTRRTGHTESVGTVHYMAPEVAQGRYGKELDIYALGVMLYELLTGHLPFEGESVAEVLMKHLTAKPDLSPLPEPYRWVVGRALEKDPDDRFRSVEEMMAALNSRELTAPGVTDMDPASGMRSGRRCLPAIGRRGLSAIGRRCLSSFERPVAAMIVKSPRERLTELIGSLLLSAVAAAAACCVIVVLQANHGQGAAALRPEQCAWLLVVSIAGSWAVLAR